MTKRVGTADARNRERRLASGPGVIDDRRGVPSWAVTIDGDREPVSVETVQLSDHDGIPSGAGSDARCGWDRGRSHSGTAAVSCARLPVLAFRLLESACATDAGIASGNALGLSLRAVPRRCAGTGWQLERSERQSMPGASRARGRLRQRGLSR
jgi:hypothetical protein